MAIQKGTAIVFGITPSLQTYGLLQRYEINDSIQRSTALAPDNAVVSIQEHHDIKKLDLTYLTLSTGSGDPEIGTPFVFAGSTWQIDSIVDGRVVDGFASKNVEAHFYPGIQ